VRLLSGEVLAGRATVVATAAPEARRLLGSDLEVPAWHGVVTFWFATDRPPLDEPVLVLDGEGRGPVNDLHVASAVSPTRAPPGAALLGATVLDDRGLSDAALEEAVRDHLGRWFGVQVSTWRLLALQRIPHALPDQPPGVLRPGGRGARLRAGRYVCGDYREHGSIEGALVSGRRAADAVRADLEREERR
jgi:phytoene dehydrogenase-like protein